MFEIDKIQMMLDLERDNLITSDDNKWVMYKLDWVDKIEFRVEKNTETIHRFQLQKNERLQERLTDYLFELGLFKKD
jgi:hypothetical protein